MPSYYQPVMWSLAISLSLAAGVWTVLAYHRRRTAAVLAGLGLILLPWAALMTGVLLLVLRIASAVGLWAGDLVFRPSMWLGVGLFAGSFALLAAARRISARSRASGSTKAARGTKRTKAAPPEALPRGRGAEPAIDDDLAEIEAILRDRGIT